MNTLMKTTFALLIFAGLGAGAQAQVTDKKSLTIEGAKRVIFAAVAEAKRLMAPGGVIAVVDDGGNLMALERLDGTFAAGASISIGKARTAVLFKRPTRVFEEIIKNGRTAMVALPDALFTPLQGGVPITINGQVIGGIGVSGAASAEQDEELAVAGAKVFNSVSANGEHLSMMAPGEVAYFDNEKVAAAFAKGAVLFDASDKYMVHASRRDRAGLAEVHLKDADIIYVLEGTATLVTGGTVIEPKTVAADEIRGREIAGGNARHIKKGDVLVVPAGTPHWFKEVPATLLYYVVKAR